jgi:hypothetical protein
MCQRSFGPATRDVSFCGEFHLGEVSICLQCAELHDGRSACPYCGSEVELEEALARYGRDIARYGYQYREAYERHENVKESQRNCLTDLPELYSWLALAALGGIVGNLSTDAVKALFRKIIESSEKYRANGPSYEKLAKITDEDLERFYEYAREYHTGMKGISRELRNAIIEEMLADAVSEDEYISKELAKLIFRENIKPKHKKKAAMLYRAALQKKMAHSQVAKKSVIEGLWRNIQS